MSSFRKEVVADGKVIGYADTGLGHAHVELKGQDKQITLRVDEDLYNRLQQFVKLYNRNQPLDHIDLTVSDAVRDWVKMGLINHFWENISDLDAASLTHHYLAAIEIGMNSYLDSHPLLHKMGTVGEQGERYKSRISWSTGLNISPIMSTKELHIFGEQWMWELKEYMKAIGTDFAWSWGRPTLVSEFIGNPELGERRVFRVSCYAYFAEFNPDWHKSVEPNTDVDQT